MLFDKIWVSIYRDTDVTLFLMGRRHASKRKEQYEAFVASLLHGFVPKQTVYLDVQLRRDVQHWLAPPNPSTKHNTFWSARRQGTAAWFFENEVFTSWKTTGSLLWIHGIRASPPTAGLIPTLTTLSYSWLRQKHTSVCSIRYSIYLHKGH
jgi:hypothetical protein